MKFRFFNAKNIFLIFTFIFLMIEFLDYVEIDTNKNRDVISSSNIENNSNTYIEDNISKENNENKINLESYNMVNIDKLVVGTKYIDKNVMVKTNSLFLLPSDKNGNMYFNVYMEGKELKCFYYNKSKDFFDYKLGIERAYKNEDDIILLGTYQSIPNSFEYNLYIHSVIFSNENYYTSLFLEPNVQGYDDYQFIKDLFY